jgi:pyridoxal phosphate-dependent aminotransferase EpsN
VDAFEEEFASVVGTDHAVALSSGTAALHLALLLAGVGEDDEVLVSTLTFAASVFPIRYLGAKPAFLDSEKLSWNVDPNLLEDALRNRAAQNCLPAAFIPVHLYGQCADLDSIMRLCAEYEVPVIEDAAEALGATYRGRPPGADGQAGVFSFNGNKIITTSGGGMLVTKDADMAGRARKLAAQAREDEPHYEHAEVGYNYRMSNILAALGRGQLAVLDDRVEARRRNFHAYREALGDLPGLTFQPEAPWGRHTRWLTCVLVEPDSFGADREGVRLALEMENVESRPLWKPMHLQPVFDGCEVFGGEISKRLFQRGICLPSGSSLTDVERRRVVGIIRRIHEVGDTTHRASF